MLFDRIPAELDALTVLVETTSAHGTGFFIAERTVLTCRHTIGTNTTFSVDGRAYDNASIVYDDEANDLVALKVDSSVERWLIPSDNPLLNKHYLYLSRSRDSTEAGLVRADGYRTRASRLELKLADGQIKSGFSGSPLIDPQTGMLAGIIHITADRRAALGGYGSPGSLIARIRKSLRLDSNDHRQKLDWRPVSNLFIDFQPRDLTLSPLRDQPCFGRDDQLDTLQSRPSSGWVAFVNGRSRSGKTALASAWLYRLKLIDFPKRAYLDLAIFANSSYPVVRAIARQLSITLPPDPFNENSHEDNAALLRVFIRQELADTLVVLDAPQTVSNDFNEDLHKLNQAMSFALAATVYCSNDHTDTAWSVPPLVIGPRINLGPIDHTAAAQLLEFLPIELTTSDRRDFLELLETHELYPGDIADFFSGHKTANDDDVYSLADEFHKYQTNRAIDDLNIVFQSTAATEHRAIIQRALTSFASSHTSPITVQTSNAALTVECSLDALLAYEPTQGFCAEIATEMVEDGAVDTVGAALMLEALPDLGVQDDTFGSLRSLLADLVTVSSRDDPLGPIVVSAPGTPHLSAMHQWIARYGDPHLRFSSLQRLVDFDPGAFAHTDERLELARRQLRQLDARYGFPVKCQAVRLQLLDAARARKDSSLEYLELISDGVQSDILAGRRHEWPIEDLQSTALTTGRVRELQTRAVSQQLWTSTTQEDAAANAATFTVDFLALSSDGMDRQSACTLAGEFLLAGRCQNLALDQYGEVLEWCRGALFDSGLLYEQTGVASRLMRRVTRALESSATHSLLKEFLAESTTALASARPILRDIAIAGDNRPVLTLCRQLRRLSLLQRRSFDPMWTSTEAEAIDGMKWTVANAPSAGAWLTLIRAVGSQSQASFVDDLLTDEYQSDREVESLKEVRKAYRRWAQGQPVTPRLQEIEYSLLRFEWRTEGSLYRRAMGLNANWRSAPIGAKISGIRTAYRQRSSLLRAMRNRLGYSDLGAMMMSALETQYQNSLAVVTKTDPDLAPVDELLANALTESGNSPFVQLDIARHLRHRREFTAALDSYEKVNAALGGDFALRREHHIGWAEALVQAVLNNVSDRETACNRAYELVSEYTKLDTAAAVVAMKAQLELSRGSLSYPVERLRDAFASDGGYAFMVANERETLSELSGLEQCDGLELVSTIATDFTNPSLLVPLGSFFIRSFALSPDNGLRTLRAALNCLDGARMMSFGQWYSDYVNFHTGVALTCACRFTGESNPLGWSREMGFKYSSDEVMGSARLQSAADSSVGSFRRLILDYLNSDDLVPCFTP